MNGTVSPDKIWQLNDTITKQAKSLVLEGMSQFFKSFTLGGGFVGFIRQQKVPKTDGHDELHERHYQTGHYLSTKWHHC